MPHPVEVASGPQLCMENQKISRSTLSHDGKNRVMNGTEERGFGCGGLRLVPHTVVPLLMKVFIYEQFGSQTEVCGKILFCLQTASGDKHNLSHFRHKNTNMAQNCGTN